MTDSSTPAPRTRTTKTAAAAAKPAPTKPAAAKPASAQPAAAKAAPTPTVAAPEATPLAEQLMALDMSAAPGFFRALIDFRFTTFITRRIAGFIYAILLVSIVLSGLVAFFSVVVTGVGLMTGGQPIPGLLTVLGAIVLTPVAALVAIVLARMIVEVNGGDAADFGFQWQGLLGKSGDKFGVVTGTNFGNAGPSIIDINTSAVQGTVNVGQGLNIGLLAVTNGVTSLAAIAKLLQTQAETNIVSTPNLITLDNEEAKIVVGENVPFITGQFTQTGGATTNPFQTIERKDVGITLRIRPQIGEGGAVRMQIFQEQSSVKSDVAAGTSNAGPSTTKRSIENTVVVDDGAILVLGGLIEDRFVTSRSKVPLLGDIPLIGGLFRSESRERRRTNLMVFLRPVVMRDAESANRFSADRYDQIRGEQKSAQPRPSIVMPINESPVLPPLRPASAPVTTPPPLNPPPNPQPSQPATLPPNPDGSPAAQPQP